MARARLITSVLLATLFVGCAGYRVGPVNGTQAKARAVTVAPFRNDTFEPRLTEAVSFALRRKVQQDGTYRLDTQNEGDILLTGVIREFRRTPLSFDPSDILTTRDYEVAIVADVSAVERSTGKEIFKREFIGRSTVRATANRDTPERQAHPTIAEDLARNITSALTEGSW